MNSTLETLNHLQIPVWIYDVQNACIPWSNALGLAFWDADSMSALAARDLRQGMSDTVHSRLQQYLIDCHDKQTTYKEFWTVYPNDVPQSAEIVFTPFTLKGRSVLLIHVLFEQVEVSSDSLYSTQALMHTSTMISLYDAQLELKYANQAARNVALREGMAFSEQLVSADDLQAIKVQLAETGSSDIECLVRTATGVVWHALSIRESLDSVTGEQSILVSATDVTERRRAQQRVLTLAYTDSLTRLPNRMSLLKDIDELISRRGTSGPEFAILFVDLDRFKLINDSLGHSAGDQLLNRFADILKSSVGVSDTVGRLGGDEFVILVKRFGERAELTNLIEKIQRQCALPMVVAGHTLRLTTSFGICTFPEHGSNITQLLQHADLAMYAAKKAGKTYAIYEDEMGRRSRERLSLENDLAGALEAQQFELFYQPKLGSACNTVVGVEALIRWRHPERGFVSPMDFIPVVEENGMIVDIGQWVLEQACIDQLALSSAGHPLSMAINISAKQFLASDFADSVRNIFQTVGTDPSMLDLEITESVLVGDRDHLLTIMRDLHDYGVRFSIDDFGTGYSNLAYLQKYPLDSLKIDKAFVDDIEDGNDLALLEVILGMAKILDLKLVAEGVETRKQVDWLTKRECDELQGFYFSKPVPLPELIDFLENYGKPDLCQAV